MTRYYLNCFHKGATEFGLVNNVLDNGVVGIANSYVENELVKQVGLEIYSWERELLTDLSTRNICQKIATMNALHEDLKRPQLNGEMISHCFRQFMRQIYCTDNYQMFSTIIEYMVLRSSYILQNLEVDKVISMVVPHHFGDYIIAAVGKQLGLSSTFVEEDIYFNLEDRQGLFIRSIEDGAYYENRSELAQTKRSNKKDKIENNILDRYNESIKKYAKNARRESVKGIIHMLKYSDNENSLRQIQYLKSLKDYINMKKIGDSEPNQYFVACLHVEPEATTSPLSFEWINQMNYLAFLAPRLNKLGFSIILREHPAQITHYWGDFNANCHLYLDENKAPRSIGRYQEMLNLEGVVGFDKNSDFVSTLEDKRCKGVISLNGTVLIEAIEKRKIAMCYKNWIGSKHSMAVSVSKDMSGVEFEKCLNKSMELIDRECEEIGSIISEYWIGNDMEGLKGMVFSSKIHMLLK